MKTYKLNNVEVSKQELQELIKNNPELLEENDKNWRAEKTGGFYVADYCGSIEMGVERKEFAQDFLYNTLNYFQTEKQAEAYRDYLLAVGRVSRAIWEANGDWEEDWSDIKKSAVEISFNHKSKTLEAYSVSFGIESAVVIPYVANYGIAEQIIKDYKEDLLTIFNYKK